MTRTCWECGRKEAKEHFNLFSQEGDMRFPILKDIHQREYCEECFQRIAEEQAKDKTDYIRLKQKLMFERALVMFERQGADIYEYREAISAVQEHVAKNPEKYQSSHEILTAIVLVENELQVKVQCPIGQYRVDFLIPRLKVVLEIDGYMHDYRTGYDSNRDIAIRQALGKDWETVRIPTKYIEQNAELLVEAIKTMKADIQRVRSENHGLLPGWYSKRSRSQKKSKRANVEEF